MDSHVRLNCCCLPVTCGLASLQIWKIQVLLEAKDYSTHHSEAAVITPSIVLTIINCLQLRHDYLQLTDYIGHHSDYRAAVLRSRVENMGKGKHFEITTMSSRGNSQVPWNAQFSKPIDQCNPGIMFRRFPVPQKWVDAGYVKDCVTASMCHMMHSRLFFHCFSSRNPPSWDLKSARNSKTKKSKGKPNKVLTSGYRSPWSQFG